MEEEGAESGQAHSRPFGIREGGGAGRIIILFNKIGAYLVQ